MNCQPSDRCGSAARVATKYPVDIAIARLRFQLYASRARAQWAWLGPGKRLYSDGVSTSSYRIEWNFLNELPEDRSGSRVGEAHCVFMVRFLDVPPGDDHCAFFATNVVTSEEALRLGIAAQRGFQISDTLTRSEFQAQVTAEVQNAFTQADHREVALQHLNRTYIHQDQDFRDEFRADAPSAEALAEQVELAFAGVQRGNGISLHEAIAIDDYATPEERATARSRDVDMDWHDAPADLMISTVSIWSVLDGEGLRYYLPAAILLCLDLERAEVVADLLTRTYWSLLPMIAPRDQGKGLGERFDPGAIISEGQFSDLQIQVSYRFLCWAAVEHEGVDEDQLPAMRKWRARANQADA